MLWVGLDRTIKTLLRFFDFRAKNAARKILFVCSDMWQAYMKVIAKKVPLAIYILDRFHVMQKMSKAIDKVRAAEVKQMLKDGYEPLLKGSRWLLLKRRENLTEQQAVKMKHLIQYNLKSVRSHLMKEDFQQFWTYTYLCTSVKGRLEIIFRIAKFRAADLCFCAIDRWLWVFGESPASR